jgi:hypothetical protein
MQDPHDIVSFLSIGALPILYALYSAIFCWVVRRLEGDLDALRPLIPISFALIMLPIAYVFWRGWFREPLGY